ncbi:MAG: hypothetical protein C0519_09475 [Hyphomicrobium sp.]|jgi:hypothetical protein|nr:hypothetical protein [Hyphomicrobium sp.]PPD08489.1 MAG: hypothetical protein CTY28_03605 [Hyphomicrobium sp.]
MTRKPSQRLIRMTLAVISAVAIGGCSMDDVELNGGVFDSLGIGSNQPKSAEPKLAARTPLVVPPSTASLPAPGAPPEAVQSDVTVAIDDPDRKIIVTEAEKQKQQDEYCRKNYDPARAAGDASADSIEGPLGPCRPSVLTAVKKWNGGEGLLDSGNE